MPALTNLPRLPRGHCSAAVKAAYDRQCAELAALILRLRRRFNFAPSTRGWCYVLEGYDIGGGRRSINKGDFKDAEALITRLRKSGLLPIDICAEDDRRKARGLERLDKPIDDMIAGWVKAMRQQPDQYTPVSFWAEQAVYLEVAVEKVDLRNLFKPVTDRYHMVISNVGGWADLHVRVAMLVRLYQMWHDGHECHLGYCGDHDPGGMIISDSLPQNLSDVAGAAALVLTQQGLIGFMVDGRWVTFPVSEDNVKAMIDDLVIERFGLNADFIDANGLTWIDNLETSSGRDLGDPSNTQHHKAYVQDYIRRYGRKKCEANALVVRPRAAEQLVEGWILDYLPSDAVDRYEATLGPIRDDYMGRFYDRFNLWPDYQPPSPAPPPPRRSLQRGDEPSPPAASAAPANRFKRGN
jgi:hypothetical protein